MVSESKTSDFDPSRAELFEALGHPLRLRILESLSHAPLSFSGLKKKVEIDSSGHLQFHLGKLDGLVTTDPEGNYVLTDEGREALRLLITMRSGTEEEVTEPSRKRLPILGIVLAGLILASGVAIYLFPSYLSWYLSARGFWWNSTGTLSGSISYVVSGPTIVNIDDSYEIRVGLHVQGPVDIEYVRVRVFDRDFLNEFYVEDVWKNIKVSGELNYEKNFTLKGLSASGGTGVQIIAKTDSSSQVDEVETGDSYAIPELHLVYTGPIYPWS